MSRTDTRYLRSTVVLLFWIELDFEECPILFYDISLKLQLTHPANYDIHGLWGTFHLIIRSPIWTFLVLSCYPQNWKFLILYWSGARSFLTLFILIDVNRLNSYLMLMDTDANERRDKIRRYANAYWKWIVELQLLNNDTLTRLIAILLLSRFVKKVCRQETLLRNRQDHWFPPNQSEYSLFAAFIFQQSGLALVGSQVLVCLVPCLDSLGLSPTIFEETLLQLCITMLQ